MSHKNPNERSLFLNITIKGRKEGLTWWDLLRQKQGKQKEFEASLCKLRRKDANISSEAAEIQVYIRAFSAGMGAVPWVVMPEIFATPVNWFGAWACSYTFMSWSSYGTFILYVAVNALAIVFVIKVVPETKGRTVEQISCYKILHRRS